MKISKVSSYKPGDPPLTGGVFIPWKPQETEEDSPKSADVKLGKKEGKKNGRDDRRNPRSDSR